MKLLMKIMANFYGVGFEVQDPGFRVQCASCVTSVLRWNTPHAV